MEVLIIVVSFLMLVFLALTDTNAPAGNLRHILPASDFNEQDYQGSFQKDSQGTEKIYVDQYGEIHGM